MFRDARAYSGEFAKLKQALNRNLVVLLVEFKKRNKFTILAVKHHLMIQGYTDDTTL